MVSFKIILKLVLHFDWQKGAAVFDPNDIDAFDILIWIWEQTEFCSSWETHAICAEICLDVFHVVTEFVGN